ncbi:glycosyltransferase family 2 protein [Flavobacteriaceae bacterium TP-CH-4]|uniref:Glycosyltransferase family 2 protein n=1 Tax=Pelagihabitans pacificus TaxID=2696054 RepID=A0A967ASS6_9FLAO|nr:glycosyltransferase family A protein [Pelagihabitans pacificus]NHF58288.1 glycosyltransferase family 2 protein [Pelagihabitans pacificus]
MRCYIIIPSHNEEAYLADTLDSILRQTLPPKKVVIVNDHSTDGTEAIIDSYTEKHSVFQKVNTASSTEHMPGSKVIDAFNKGLEMLDSDYDFLMKLDADIILPDDYLEKVAYVFKGNPKVGITGGFAYEKDSEGVWQRSHPMNNDHVRGAFKAYSKNCFKAIDGLKSAMGWDTVDELLARYHGFEIYTDEALRVKHLRPVGNAYDQKAKLLQGRAMYRMRYGYWITFIASLKMAWKQRKRYAFFDNMEGYLQAEREQVPYLVSEEEGKFIRKFRWRNMKRKLV